MVKKQLYIVDGSSYIYRAYHAVAPLTTRAGLHTHAILGFVTMIQRLVKEQSPDFLVVAFDSRGAVFRHEMYDAYKANRPPMPDDLAEQIPYIKRFVKAEGLLSIEEQGVEADDIIASVAKRFASECCGVTIVSGDKDLLQLVDQHVVMFDPMKNKIMDVQAVCEKYGVRVDQLLDTFALMGDSSDNVPGVPGVGPKTAQKLIQEYGSLDGLYVEVEGMKPSKMKERIVTHREQAFLSRDLIRLKEDVIVPNDLEMYALREGDGEELVTLFGELEFAKFLKKAQDNNVQKISTAGFELVDTLGALEQLIHHLSDCTLMVVDTETTSLEARTAQLVGISICLDLKKAYYIPLGHLDASDQLLGGQLLLPDVVTALAPFFTSEDILKVGHNLKFDWTVLKSQTGIEMWPLADTMVAAHLLENERSLKLDDLCLDLGFQLTSFEEVVEKDKRANAFAYVPIEKACHYSCEDVYGALALWKMFKQELVEKELSALFYDVEMKLVPLLAQMEMRGICVDESVLSDLSVQFAARILQLETEIYNLVGHEFNLNSPKQLGGILFEELDLPQGRKTKTGYSTDVKVLEKLALHHPVPALILKYRTLAKLKSTYVDRLVLLKDSVSGRVHTSFNQTVTATGRLSSSNPNMQNIPIRMEEGNLIRKAFIPQKGMLFLAADYSQIDLRVLAHYSGDKALTQAFLMGEDIHARTAAELFNVSPLLINGDMRRVAKSINFGIVYGMSAYGLAQQLDINRKDAQRFIDKYFHLYDGVKQFMFDIVEKTRRDGFVTTLLGRRRTVFDIDSTNKNKRDFAERMAINTPIQGTAADIIKCAMINVESELHEQGLTARMLLQIHDELVFEVDESEIEKTRAVVCRVMESAMKLNVPLVVNCDVTTSLAKP